MFVSFLEKKPCPILRPSHDKRLPSPLSVFIVYDSCQYFTLDAKPEITFTKHLYLTLYTIINNKDLYSAYSRDKNETGTTLERWKDKQEYL